MRRSPVLVRKLQILNFPFPVLWGYLFRMSLDRRAFLGTSLASAALLTVRPLLAAPFELEEATIAVLAAGMRDGKFTSRRLTELYLGRIAALDKPVASILYTNPDAIRDADALDAERKAGKVRGPLHGIPILIKGNIDTADKMATTAGSLALAGRDRQEGRLRGRAVSAPPAA